jgi:hypothetical protein
MLENFVYQIQSNNNNDWRNIDIADNSKWHFAVDKSKQGICHFFENDGELVDWV